MIEHLQQLFAYDDWANRETAQSVLRAAAAPGKAQRILAHLVGTQWLWYARLRQETPRMAVWPELSPAECLAELPQLRAAWEGYFAALDPPALQRVVSYTNTKGERWSDSVHDILMHIVLHGGYHRGQVATLLRDSGHEPAYTDFIHAVRTGRL